MAKVRGTVPSYRNALASRPRRGRMQAGHGVPARALKTEGSAVKRITGRDVDRFLLGAMCGALVVFLWFMWRDVRRWEPPEGGCSFHAFLAGRASIREMRTFRWQGAEYLEVIGPERRWFLVAGPPCWLFDRSGTLVGWSVDRWDWVPYESNTPESDVRHLDGLAEALAWFDGEASPRTHVRGYLLPPLTGRTAERCRAPCRRGGLQAQTGGRTALGAMLSRRCERVAPGPASSPGHRAVDRGVARKGTRHACRGAPRTAFKARFLRSGPAPRPCLPEMRCPSTQG